jgi:hypothetical protein
VYDRAAMTAMRTAKRAFSFAIVSSLALAVAPDAGAAAGAVDLRYFAPPSCPDRAAFEARLRHRTQAAQVDPRATRSPRRFDVRVVLGAERAEGRIVVVDADGTTATRRIEAATCEEAVDGLALIAALTLDPNLADSNEAAEDRAAEGGASEEHAAEDGAAEDRVAAGGAEPLAGTSATGSETDRAADETTSADRTADGGAHAADMIGLDVSVSALVTTGVAPGAGVGGSIAIGLARIEAPVDLSAFLGFRLTAPQSAATTPDGGAEFAWWSGVAGGCAGRADPAAVSLWACAVAELGRLTAAGRETGNAQTSSRRWLAVGPLAALEWSPTSPVFLRAAAGVGFPLERDRFLLGDRVISQVLAAALRGEAGAGARFW